MDSNDQGLIQSEEACEIRDNLAKRINCSHGNFKQRDRDYILRELKRFRELVEKTQDKDLKQVVCCFAGFTDEYLDEFAEIETEEEESDDEEEEE